MAPEASRPTSPTWSSIPNKFQLALICSVRIVDFFQQAALQAYMFYQLASFSPDATESEISFQAGILQGVFTAAQVFTSPLWGRVADSSRYGRKGVIIASLVGQATSCLGVAFSSTFTTAVCWRFLGGAVNASVGGARTALSECTEKKYHSRTFLLLPLAWNIANIFGPLLGGVFSDPVRYHPTLFGINSMFGGEHGVAWLEVFPYAAPNLVSSFLLLADAMLIFLFLQETHITARHGRDRGIELRQNLQYILRRIRLGCGTRYEPLQQFEGTDKSRIVAQVDDNSLRLKPVIRDDVHDTKYESVSATDPTRAANKTRILTSNVFLVLSMIALLDFQLGGFTGLWSTFLSTSPRSPEYDPIPDLPFDFTGGLGFSPSTIGLAMSVLGVVGIVCQLTLYPYVVARFGLLRSTAFSLFLFPIAYLMTPYLSLLGPYSSSALRSLLWTCIIGIATLVISARTFAMPGAVLLVNNAAPSPETLGTIHGFGAATSSAFRTLGPIVAGRWYQVGLRNCRIGEAWWWLALWSLIGCIPVWWMKE